MTKLITGHVCNYCHAIDGKQSKENPRRTDRCVKCGHRGGGIRKTMEQLEWGQLRVISDALPQGGEGES